MIIAELVLYFITYTVLVIALFIGILCYKKSLESRESIAFTASLLLLVSSVSLSAIIDESVSAFIIQVAMLALSVTTFLNILQERKHNIKPLYVKIHTGAACVLLVAAGVSFLTVSISQVQWLIVSFLIVSVVASMAMMRFTDPQKRYIHLEKANRIFSIVFMTVIPVYLVFHFGFSEEYNNLRIGFLLPLAFILLALHKIYDDLQRLTLIRNNSEPEEQHFINYDLTNREREIAILLAKGLSYQAIAGQLFISLPTVKTHCSHIYKKCGVKSRHELTALIAA